MEYKKALNKSMHICSRKEQCIFDIKEKLYKWDVRTNDIEKIIKQLLDDKYVDEERYVRHYINDKIWINKWGVKKVSYSLKLKKIASENVISAIETLDMYKYFHLIRSELEKKRNSIRDSSDLKVKAKLFAFGSSRGYESELIYKSINVILSE